LIVATDRLQIRDEQRLRLTAEINVRNVSISWKERITNEEVIESELVNTAWMTYSAKEDAAGLDM